MKNTFLLINYFYGVQKAIWKQCVFCMTIQYNIAMTLQKMFYRMISSTHGSGWVYSADKKTSNLVNKVFCDSVQEWGQVRSEYYSTIS